MNVVRLSNNIDPIILVSLLLTHPHFLEDVPLSWMISFTMTRMSIMNGQKERGHGLALVALRRTFGLCDDFLGSVYDLVLTL